MEDNGRELDPDPINTTPVKDGCPTKKEITIMLIGSVGKMRSFKISRKLILYASVFLLIYTVISLIIFYLYFDLYFTHKIQSEDLQNLEIELSNKKKDLEHKKLLIKVLEDSRKGADEKSETKTAKEEPPKKNRAKVNEPSKKKNQVAVSKKSEKESADAGSTLKKASEPVKQKEIVPSEMKSQETVQKEPEKKSEDMGATGKEASELSKPEEAQVKTEEPA